MAARYGYVPFVLGAAKSSSLSSSSTLTSSCASQVRRVRTSYNYCSLSSIAPLSTTRPTLPRSAFRSPHQRNMSSSSSLRSLNINNINPHVVAAKYAVRGELAVKSEAYRARLAKGDKSLPFEEIISANIGNPQQLDQKPITFFRQVLSLLEFPPLLAQLEKDAALREKLAYETDVLERARKLLGYVGSVGAYSASMGALGVRESVAKFIEERDGHPSDPASIYLSAGASSGVNTLLHIICAKPSTGVLVPIPQYPLYTATLSLVNARCVPYYLSEATNWGTSIEAIKSGYSSAVEDGTDVRAIAVINPGNPTGASLPESDIEAVIAFAAEKKLVILADEVYQTNVFKGKFNSFKGVLRNMQKASPGKYDNVELASLHSTSKGMVGECGHRGGYFELVGFDKEVQEQIYKFVSISLCAPVIGQCLVEMMVNPPKPDSPSHKLYKAEYDAIFAGLQKRATALYEAFKKMEGVKCQEPQGSMYLFPTITLSEKAAKKAEELGKKVDEYYCLRLLEETGICVVPGSGFGQEPGTFHFRTTFLAPGTEWAGRVVAFHEKFMDEYR